MSFLRQKKETLNIHNEYLLAPCKPLASLTNLTVPYPYPTTQPAQVGIARTATNNMIISIRNGT